MSNYTLYKYNNSAINIVIGDSFSYLENSSMNRTEIIAYQGMDNDYFFDVRNKDRKLQNVKNSEFQAELISFENSERVLTKFLTAELDKGSAKLTLTEDDLNDLAVGNYKLIVSQLDSNGSKTPIYADKNNKLGITVIVKDDALKVPAATQTANTWLQVSNTNDGDTANIFQSSALDGNSRKNFRGARHTLAVYCTNFSGNIYVQGNNDLVASSDDAKWFGIDPLGTQIFRIPLTSATGPLPYNFTGNFNSIRFQYSPNSTNAGTVEKVLLRN